MFPVVSGAGAAEQNVGRLQYIGAVAEYVARMERSEIQESALWLSIPRVDTADSRRPAFTS